MTYQPRGIVEIQGILGGVLLVACYKLPRKELVNTDLEAVLYAHMVGDLNCKHCV